MNCAIRSKIPRDGRIQTMVRRALIFADRALTTRELMRFCYGDAVEFWHYRQVREAARKFAVEIDRRRSRGTPILWALKPTPYDK
jgi:hypothetical protein